jgi:hypothetical protein
MDTSIKLDRTKGYFNCRYSGCGKTFVYYDTLIKHSVKHSDPSYNDKFVKGSFVCSKCDKKFIYRNTLDKHVIKHSDPNNDVLRAGEFYYCPELYCNRKYKTKGKVYLHLSRDHIISEKPDLISVVITTQNKRQIEQSRKNEYQRQSQEKNLKLVPKEPSPVPKVDDISLNQETKLCVICQSDPCNTAVIPCGHKSFCYSCIEDYHKKYPLKGCPICNGNINVYCKIFE